MCPRNAFISRFLPIRYATAPFDPLEGRKCRSVNGQSRSRFASAGECAMRLQWNQSDTEQHAPTVVGSSSYGENVIAPGRVTQVQGSDVTENLRKNVEDRPKKGPLPTVQKTAVKQLVN